MAKNDELPPIGLPLVEPRSFRYFIGITAMVIFCGAIVFAIGYGSLRLSSGPCDGLYAPALSELRAEVKFFRKAGTDLGVSSVEIQELRSSTQVATESLDACCEQQPRAIAGRDRFQECRDHAMVIAELPAELAAAHDDPAAAKKVIRTASKRLRDVAYDLTVIANRSDPSAPANVASGPPSETSAAD